MDTPLQQQASRVIRLISRAQKLFGAPARPTPAPSFVTRADLEDNLGRGRFDGDL